MSVKVWSLCWKVPLPGIPKLVLLRLADFANESGGSIYPAVSTVAEDCGISSRTVQNALRTLEESGVLVSLKASRGGRGCTTSYRIDLIKAAELAGPARLMERDENGHHENYAPPSYSFDIGIPSDASVDAAKNYESPSENYAGDSKNYESPSKKGAGDSYNPSLTVKEPPLTANAGPSPTRCVTAPVNGGGKAVQDVIDEHYRLVDEIWGEEEGKSARRNPPKNYELAGEWLVLAKGDFDVVAAAMADALQRRFNKSLTCPATLGACGLSVPDNIKQMLRPCTLTAGSPYSAGKARQGGEEEALWRKVSYQAALNWHDDILTELQRLGPIDPDAANALAEEVKELVSRPKEQAAA